MNYCHHSILQARLLLVTCRKNQDVAWGNDDLNTFEGNLQQQFFKPEDIAAAESILKKQLPEVLQHIEFKSFSNSHLSPSHTTRFDSWLEKIWERIESIGEKVVKFVVEKAQDVWHFVVHLAGEIWAKAFHPLYPPYQGLMDNTILNEKVERGSFSTSTSSASVSHEAEFEGYLYFAALQRLAEEIKVDGS